MSAVQKQEGEYRSSAVHDTGTAAGLVRRSLVCELIHGRAARWVTILATVGAAIGGCNRPSTPAASTRPDVEWRHYGGDAGGTKYSPLSDIDRHNVARLELAWMVRTGDLAMESSGAANDATLTPAVVNAIRFETTPLMRDGSLYVSTPRGRVLALDPASGATRWTFDPGIDVTRRYAEDLTSRGVSAWTDEAALPHTSCARRIILATVDARLFSIDAVRGIPCADFGDGGLIDLRTGVAPSDRPLTPSEYTITSPPAVVGDVVVVGSAIPKNAHRSAASGAVRAFDARTDALRWSFDPIPRTPDHPAWALWRPSAALRTGGGNVWSIISADIDRDLVFLPTSSPAPDAYGGERPGRNDFANSVVAVRASTGEVVWSFQVVHHDLWDYDVAAQPVLITVRRNGREIPAVAVGTKTGMIFVLDRESGVPLFPVEERAVPPSDVPGEAAWPTQPFPADLPLLHPASLHADSAFGITDSERAFCRDRIAQLRNDGPFTPPSLQGSLVWPGLWGGINWDGMAWDPEREVIVTPVKRMAMGVQLHRRDELEAVRRDRQPGLQYLPQEGTPYGMTRFPLVAPSGVPCTPPPWGSLVAVDLRSASIRWDRPLGTVPSLMHLPGAEAWGSIVFGGPLLTAGGLVFVGASQDDRFRAFDVDSGDLLWEHDLPAGGQAAPMTYRYGGRQYVVIAAGGRSGVGSIGDWIVAFALPEAMASSTSG